MGVLNPTPLSLYSNAHLPSPPSLSFRILLPYSFPPFLSPSRHFSISIPFLYPSLPPPLFSLSSLLYTSTPSNSSPPFHGRLIFSLPPTSLSHSLMESIACRRHVPDSHIFLQCLTWKLCYGLAAYYDVCSWIMNVGHKSFNI